MKRSIILAMIAAIGALSGCAEVPEEVLQDMSGYREESRVEYQESDEEGFRYVKVTDLAENVESALKMDCKQFAISDKIRFRQPDELHVMRFEGQHDLKNFYEVMGMFFDQETLHSLDVEFTDKHSVIMDDDAKIYACTHSDGFVAALTPQGYELSYGEEGDVAKIYHADRADDLSDVYPLADRDYSVAEAVEFANKFLRENYQPFFPDYEYEVETIVVRQPGEKCYFSMTAHAVYKGVPLDSYTCVKKPHSPGMDYVDQAILMKMLSSDEISVFTNGGNQLKPIEVENVEECISLDSVLEYCANEFADFKEVELSEIGLMYTIRPVYDKEYDEYAEGSVEMKVLYYESRPVWELIMDIPRDQIKKEETPEGDMRKTIYIDALTGEMDYMFDPASRL